MEAGADVAVRVGRRVVVHVEQAVVLVLVIVATEVQTRVARVEVPVIRHIASQNAHRLLRRESQYFVLLSLAPHAFFVGRAAALPAPLPQGSFMRREPMLPLEPDAELQFT